MLDATIIKDYIKTSHKKGEGRMCAQDVENLLNWVIDQDMLNNIHQLAEEGYQEMAGIGHRLSNVFQDLLSNMDDDSYTLRATNDRWVQNCVKAFIKGVGNRSLTIETSNSNYDILAVKEGIQKRTGINVTLSNENITSLYDLCRYTSSGINNTRSPWCALFTKDDLLALEYIGDLRHYYRNSYGTTINKVFGQIPLTNLLESFRLVKNGTGKVLTMYFTHATMMDMVYAALGLFKDEVPLKADKRNPERKWRSSKVSAFASNLIATLNRCTDGSRTDYNVAFYLNERPLKDICNNGECSWQEFENILQNFVNTTLNFC
ncbi:multiple inositol polyphosphate phosphatase 1-like [Battus philenor]|uniref:multiple inositol polyphosphate phosphatase 1-like n=1 Tax=Battus philenor TaxID=42288 RepID=UPI0035D05A88